MMDVITTLKAGGISAFRGSTSTPLARGGKSWEVYRHVLERIYEPAACCRRVERVIGRQSGPARQGVI